MSDNKIRILQCVSNMDRAGIETMLMNFYRNIDRNTVQFDFLCNKEKPGDYDDEIRKLGGRIFVTPGLNPLKWFKYQKYMKKLFEEHPEYEIIHCQNEAMGFPALYAAKKAGIPVRISHSHNTTTRFDLKWPVKILYKYLLKYVATDFVACGKDAGKYLFGKEVKIIHNSIDTKKFEFNIRLRNELRKKHNIENCFVIGHVGRFEPQKNHEFLINIFYDYQKINNNAILLLIGTGSLIEKIKKIVSDLNIEDKVIFTGSVPNVNEYYNAMDLFLLPSLHEGLPVVGIEAQTNGVKCLFSTNVTDEVNISKSEFLDLKDKKRWLEKIGEISKEKREKKVIINNIYDINNETKNLLNYYLEKIEVRKK